MHLLSCLEDTEEGVRSAAAQALGMIRHRLDVSHVSTLRDRLAHPDRGMRCAVAEALGPLQLPATAAHRDELLGLIEQNEPDKVGLRYAAIQAIGELGKNADGGHLAALLNCVRSQDWTTRFTAVHALRRWNLMGLRAIEVEGEHRLCSVHDLAILQEEE